MSETSTAGLQTDPAATPLVAVVIVHWRNLEDTRQCLVSLRRSDYANQMIVLVNNGSPDFDETTLRTALPDIHVLHSDTNLGFAGGCNIGIRFALSRAAEYVYLLNNDTVVRPDYISTLLHAFAHANVGIVGPTIVYDEPEARVWIAGGIYRRMLGFPHREYPGRAHCDDHIVDFVPGAAMLIRRDVFEDIGLLREDLFLYFEDLVFSLLAARAGYKTMLVGQPLVAHKVSSTAGVRGSDVFTRDKAYYFARNSLLMQRAKIVGAAFVLPGIIGQFFFVLPLYAAFCLLTGAAHAVPHYLHGLLDGLRGATGQRIHPANTP